MADIKVRIKAKVYTKMIGLNNETVKQLTARPRHVVAGYKFFSGNNEIEEGTMESIEGKTITPGQYTHNIPAYTYLNGDLIVSPVPTEEVSITPNEENQIIKPSEGAYYQQVIVKATPVEPKEITASVEPITENASDGKFFKQVTVNPTPSEERIINPTEENQIIKPSEGKLLNKVVVNAVDSKYVGSAIERQEEVTIIPTTTDQIITKDKYLTGNVIIKGEQNLKAEYIAKGITLYEGTEREIIGQLEGNGLDSYLKNELIDIIIPEEVTSLRSYMFYRWAKLNSIKLSKNLTSIGSYCFYSCTGLKEIELPEGITNLSDSMFEKSGITKITLPTTLKSTASNCFSGCTALTKIELPEGVTAIISGCFNNCTNLSEIILPSTMKSLPSSAIQTFNKNTTTIIFKGTTPPTSINSGCFPTNRFSDCPIKIVVPKGCLDAYITAFTNANSEYNSTNITYVEEEE